ncbi:MAG TPA: ATP-binding protein [Stellaceae bacterium]|nr:ATP-binding protein [Stellaceae bacterium]
MSVGVGITGASGRTGLWSPLRITLGILAALAAVTLGLLPFAGAQVIEIPGINTFLGAAVFIADLATAMLLFLRVRQTGSIAVLILVCAYALSSLLAVAYCFTFPGALMSGRPLIGSLVSVSWVFTSWMIAYPALCLLAVVTPREARIGRGARVRWSSLLAGVLVLLAALAIVSIAIATRDRLPALVIGSNWSNWDLWLSYGASAAGVASVAVILATSRRRDELMLWLSLALFTMAGGNFLSTIGGGRYTVGWYAYRLSWIVSSCVLFLYFMLQFARQQAMLARAIDNLQERTRERDRIWSVSEDLLGVSNLAGYFLSFNPAWSKTLGWSDAEIRAMHVSALRHPEDEPEATEARLALADAGTVRIENRFRHKDGSWRWIAWAMTSDNGLIYVAGRDVTHEKEAQEERRKAEIARAHSQKVEALGQLTGGVAHDFNNLLMIVGGHIGRLKDAVTGNPRAQRAAEAIETAAQRGEALTRQLLRFSRRQPTNPETLSIERRLETLRPMLLSSLGGAIELEIELPAELWEVRVDPNEFDLAIVNLVLNARDALEQGGVVRITARNTRLPADAEAGLAERDGVHLTIADNGAGIAPDILPRVFDPFFTTKQTGKGTGLGLSQVHGFANQSGGSVAVDSTLGRGTAVTLSLPRGEAPAAAKAADAAKPSTGGRVLLVEDNPSVAEITREMLGGQGYTVWLAGDAGAAFDLIGARSFDLVVSDIVMGGPMNGLELARIVRRQLPRQAILLVTGYSESAEAAMAEFTVLRKPYRDVELRAAIARAMENIAQPSSPVSAS